MDTLVSLQDYEEEAGLRIPHAVFKYLDAGAAGEVAVRLNLNSSKF